ncbi:uncharacterized protein LOC124460707 isoform X2 [Drosophila willistoni]|uniref:uncharacterized protein LOC124460707 isoform X2 n=1 Tax=Drosophila willistoni TaxID=7260 RepID=UPI001F08156E|nr:uncharacterized protein LOC124460707 isoform X2 [Drosophila willistoni]
MLPQLPMRFTTPRVTYYANAFLKWFNIFHTSLMVIAAIFLLVTTLTTMKSALLIWSVLFLIHMIAYYIIFNIMASNPFVTSTVNIVLYALIIVLSFLLDLYSLFVVYSFYQELDNPPRAPCCDSI